VERMGLDIAFFFGATCEALDVEAQPLCSLLA
jgi:hypothetical protein